MNRENRRAGWKKKLPPCPLCGLDSGERMEDAEPPFDYIVACTSCGARTRPYHGLNCATKAWGRGGRIPAEERKEPCIAVKRAEKNLRPRWS